MNPSEHSSMSSKDVPESMYDENDNGEEGMNQYEANELPQDESRSMAREQGGEEEYEEGEEMYEGEDEQNEYEQHEGEDNENDYPEDEHLGEDFYKEDASMQNRSERDELDKGSEQKSSILEEEDENLPPERKIRYRLFRFINRMRGNYRLPEYYIDLNANDIAMEYAKFLLTENESDKVIASIVKSHNFQWEYKVSCFEAFIDTSNDNAGHSGKYSELINEFYDAHATLIEFETHRDNLLSTEFNMVGIGMAFNEEKVVVCDIFLRKEVYVESCSINDSLGTIIVKGHMLDDKYGVYALRIVKPEAINKTIHHITPQNIISPEQRNRPFTASFRDVISIIEDKTQKLIEVYLRPRPETIKYGAGISDRIIFDHLILGTRVPFENFPLEPQLKEQKHEEDEEERREREEERRRIEEKERERIERNKRENNEAYGRANLEPIPEIPDAGDDISQGRSEVSQSKREESSKKDESSGKKERPESGEVEISREEDKKINYERDLTDLESKIEKLKSENESLQKKIKIIYDFKKKEGRDERTYYKESNINESTYSDSLTSTAGLYNELGSQQNKLKADLAKYNKSIQEQEKRKQEVYQILMNYKEELLGNSETRKGTKLSRAKIDEWLREEQKYEEEIKDLRIASITKSLEMNRLKKELKKMEDYFEGLHIIDFEQLKIENNTLTEKIEDRNEEIHKLRNKTNSTIQILAHFQEKYQDVISEKKKKEETKNIFKNQISKIKTSLNKLKDENDKKTLKQLNENKKIDQINSSPLKKYYKNTLNEIERLSNEIDTVSHDLLAYRKRKKNVGKGSNIKDIEQLLERKKKIIQEYRTLPKFGTEEKL